MWGSFLKANKYFQFLKKGKYLKINKKVIIL